MINFKITNRTAWESHRSGWSYVLSLLHDYESESGVLLDGYMDSTFGYESLSKSSVYEKKWIGFLHHPINICPWYHQESLSPHFSLHSENFKNSLPHCGGIFTLSEHLAAYIRMNVTPSLKVTRLFHPTEFTAPTFDLDKFRQDRKVVQVGLWMRRLSSVFRLKTTLKKYMTKNSMTLTYLKNENRFLGSLSAEELSSVTLLKHMTNSQYDQLLSESVVFLDLFDSSANNTVIECIVRNTPLVVNRIPAVEEYLGKHYPLYYSDLSEAESHLENDPLIEDAFIYLRDVLEKEHFTGRDFTRSLLNAF